MAMMMSGRVLLVCALCVLWCGADEIYAEGDLEGPLAALSPGLAPSSPGDVGSLDNTGSLAGHGVGVGRSEPLENAVSGGDVSEDLLNSNNDDEESCSADEESGCGSEDGHRRQENRDEVAEDEVRIMPQNDQSEITPKGPQIPAREDNAAQLQQKQPPQGVHLTSAAHERAQDASELRTPLSKNLSQQKTGAVSSQFAIHTPTDNEEGKIPSPPPKSGSDTSNSPEQLVAAKKERGNQREGADDSPTESKEDKNPPATTRKTDAENTHSSVSSSAADTTPKPDAVTEENPPATDSSRTSSEDAEQLTAIPNPDDASDSTENAATQSAESANKTNDTAKTAESDSDSSTAVSHTTSPLLLLVFACAAAAAVVAA
ncbi:Mucin-associated surface protein (MASP) [Trypanosoma cruzi]|uniref:Mucin-associated surface protein (MASP), putative n=2 Tax=Trypanosoma cruzi TaxID=5693 RepID=Q4D6G3_TRYCC|nr:mucin-associated surface protein (MASP), putative [Trypanosoma cruzi]EAN88112.1 mucin-associated surface protein (MASP), putative [Trypanosoma cruzi]KAF5216856.1 Mucin-associated surface protein (MASP) subgroup S010 [Trypanosoma cruzi]KAF8299524.1 Mucin-associated surface protein (MASP), subgroup S010 [Trypanosoma cruzi]PWV15125.1 Mucin-associated surface protein (MASP) [Trypanosoma cruzi]RNC61542.1 mucin-associated surface protein (MASP) [Trypanosoma cruzi]|eukprot:XP_809963.1 mucin-associated surface protein (MASP) [Trypanosoma cruzi strain CL Brener]